MHIRPYQKLIVWKEAHALCVHIYNITRTFPKDERFRIVDQICRSSSSVPTNIAEGNARKTPDDKKRFFTIAKASLEEAHYQALLSFQLEYISKEQFETIDDMVNRVSYLLVKLRKST